MVLFPFAAEQSCAWHFAAPHDGMLCRLLEMHEGIGSGTFTYVHLNLVYIYSYCLLLKSKVHSFY